MGSHRSRASRSSGRIRITPKHRPEPDLDQVVLALLAMLDEQQRTSEAQPEEPAGSDRGPS